MNRTVLACLLAAAAPAALAAPCAPPSTYGQTLLERLVAANPALLAASMDVKPPKGHDYVVAAATDRAAIGTKSSAAEVAVAATGKPAVVADPARARIEVRVPLYDVSADTIGVLDLVFHAARGAAQAGFVREALHLRDRLRRRITLPSNVFDPVPYDPTEVLPTDTYAQRLVDEVLAQHPQVEIFAIHATPPGGDYNVIAASNIGRIGKKADNDDMRAVYTGKTNLEVNETGTRFEVEMQLRDRTHRVIGAVSVVYAYHKGEDQRRLEARAKKIRAALERRIADSASLFALAH
ncbi:MAG TPA: hypothetical protein VMU86_05390 [Steroidobacteraceae bacterium]|nr:hypothetical protein [Steroidobacteraceae bacterium]